MKPYVVMASDDAYAKGIIEDDPDTYDDPYFLCLVDMRTDPPRLVATDCGEPEDYSFSRDLRWVVKELNAESSRNEEEA